MARKAKKKAPARVETLVHPADKRKNIPTAELQSYVREEEAAPKPLRYPRNPDLDPQLVWRGKDEEDGEDLTVDTVPIYIQEKVHPKAIVDDLRRISKGKSEPQADLFADFNGLPDEEAKLEFYEHDANWSNRMILGDALLVMNSLAEKEGLRGRVQCIYLDPPYGIKFNSNFQWSTTSRDVKDGNKDHLTREPEQVKAFRDTWRDGVNSYLSYLRDRLMVARDLLTESGSIFVQIGDENVHRVRAVMDEVFGEDRLITQITFVTTSAFTSSFLSSVTNYLLWYVKNPTRAKYRPLFEIREQGIDESGRYSRIELSSGVRRFMTSQERASAREIPEGARIYRHDNVYSQGRAKEVQPFDFRGVTFDPWIQNAHWKANYPAGIQKLEKANRLAVPSKNSIAYVRYQNDFLLLPRSNIWSDTQTGAFTDQKTYVVQTNSKVVERCILMATDPGDLVLDPTCGSGTTAYVAEQWGRRWITIDTSRVALALARQRLMAARYPYYLLKDSEEGRRKEEEIAGRPWPERQHRNDIRLGFVYERVPHVTLKSIANNAEIDVIHQRFEEKLVPLREQLNKLAGQSWEEWQVPRDADEGWTKETKAVHAEWWTLRRKRQEEIDASIARNAETEFLYDRPYEARNTVRVTGPFTVESLSPHRVLPTDEDDFILEALQEEAAESGRPLPPRTRKPTDAGEDDFVRVVLENLKAAGVHNTKKNERLEFTSLKPWAGGRTIHAEGRYMEGDKERRAAVCIGPEYGTVSYTLVREAAREAVDLFDVLVVCGFAFEPQVGEDTMRLGRLTVLKAHMNQDLHMAEHLKKTGAGNLFVVFGEPDIDVEDTEDGECRVVIKGVDVFDPTTGEVRSGSTEDSACWFIDTSYDEESFFVRHAYFLGAKDPYERLKRTLKAEIDEEAWATLHRAESRPFPKPATGKIAVKVINHYGDEVLKVYEVG